MRNPSSTQELGSVPGTLGRAGRVKDDWYVVKGPSDAILYVLVAVVDDARRFR
jgi:hypothetical protein